MDNNVYHAFAFASIRLVQHQHYHLHYQVNGLIWDSFAFDPDSACKILCKQVAAFVALHNYTFSHPHHQMYKYKFKRQYKYNGFRLASPLFMS